MICARCQHENPEGARFCNVCRARLEAVCPSCGHPNPPGSRFCNECGLDLGRVVGQAAQTRFASPQAYTPKHLAEKILTSRSSIEGERKQVTVLFCDLTNSTALAERLGPEAMHTLLNRFFELALAEVHRFEGTINQFLGDGFMALFGAPLAHEDHPQRAILAAAGIQRALGEHPEMGLAARMGLNTGLVVVGKIGDNLRMDYTAVGDTTHPAARLQHMTEPGTILLSEATQRLVEAYAETTFLAEREVKGLGAQQVYRLEGLKPGAVRFDVALRRGLTPLVGRRKELEILERCYQETRAGAVRGVNVIGEAGLGKSRLLYELRERLEGDQVFFLTGHCSAYGRATPFLPFIEVARTAFRVADLDSQPEIERRLRRGLEMLGIPAEDALPFLLNLLGLDPGRDAFRGLDGEIIGARTREVLEQLLRARCRLSPVILVVDDLHWTDGPSQDLLLRAAQTMERLPLLIVCAYRPEYRAPWSAGENVTELVLEPLSEENTARLVQQCLGMEDLPEELRRLLVEKAEGNPLFAEEISRYLLESGSILRVDHGLSFRPEAAPFRVPGTLQDLIMARVDRLADGPRIVLQVASVIGRRFSPEVVRTVLGLDGHMAHYLRELETQELIFPGETERRDEYLFKHGLIQEAVYDSLLTARREKLHQQVAEVIEQSCADRMGEWAEVLAHHWSRTSRVDKAVRYMALAAEKSLRVYAVEEAHDRFRQVLERIETVPGCADEAFLADVLLSSALVYYYRKDFKSLIDLLERYRTRVEALGDQRRLSLLLFWLGFALLSSDRLDTARALLERSLALGEALGDEECVGYASMGLVWFYDWVQRGQPRDIVDRLANRGFEIAKRRGDVYLACKCLAGLALYKQRCGRPLEARDLASRVLELGRSARDPRTIAMGLNLWAGQNFAEERYEEALQNAEEAFRLSPDPLDRLIARGLKGGILAMMGRPQEGLEIYAQVREESLADFGWAARLFEPYHAMVMVLAGKMAAGVRWIEDCIRRFAESGNETDPAFGHLILGEIYLQMVLGEKKPPLKTLLRNLGFVLRTLPLAARKAERHLQEAVRRAQEVGMPLHLARGLLDLGLLCQAKRRPAEARRYLEEARQIADPLALVPLSKRIRQALAALDLIPIAKPRSAP